MKSSDWRCTALYLYCLYRIALRCGSIYGVRPGKELGKVVLELYVHMVSHLTSMREGHSFLKARRFVAYM